MSALIKLYTDLACTAELRTSGAIYDLFVGPETGLNGNGGDRADVVVYAKNVGNQIAVGASIVFNVNPNNRLSMRLTATDYSTETIEVGNVAVGSSFPVYLRLTVPTGTLMNAARPNFSFKYKSIA